ncbi:hypothetical protein Afil01_24940 [Actinorhabdospora filicis]|uniref:Excreted virulence factor EspC, type VII ESX diderm n=1 Tax=Actinorhabdospora filicis TaxID=1785913 RepID=A0A9W6SKX2_9ACTN|nr:hypothetical protein [Actinorhabdospora filicis]GLZ77687.1 hypothetical protein Afil01_24940 [Actinorhabdospora filicis]
MSDTLRADPAMLRYVAGRILGDQQLQFRPRFDELRDQLVEGTTDVDAAMDGRKNGCIYGRTPIGDYHDELRFEMLTMFEGLDRGMVAISNVLASVAEDFSAADAESAGRLTDAAQYFTEGEGSGKRPL